MDSDKENMEMLVDSPETMATDSPDKRNSDELKIRSSSNIAKSCEEPKHVRNEMESVDQVPPTQTPVQTLNTEELCLSAQYSSRRNSSSLLGANYKRHNLDPNRLPTPPASVTRRRKSSQPIPRTTTHGEGIESPQTHLISPTNLSRTLDNERRRNTTLQSANDPISKTPNKSERKTSANRVKEQTLSQRRRKRSPRSTQSAIEYSTKSVDRYLDTRDASQVTDKSIERRKLKARKDIRETKKHLDDYHKMKSLQYSVNGVNYKDGMQLCSISSRKHSPFPKTPESQANRHTIQQQTNNHQQDLTSSASVCYDDKPLFPILSIILRMNVVMYCILSIISRSVITFGGRMPLTHYIRESPVLWVIRLHIVVFHMIFTLTELRLETPILTPKGTLGNYVHRGFVQSFVGLLDMCISPSMSLTETVEKLKNLTEDTVPTNEIMILISLVVLRVSSRGLVLCGISYFVFGLFGWNDALFTTSPSQKDEDEETVNLSRERMARM